MYGATPALLHLIRATPALLNLLVQLRHLGGDASLRVQQGLWRVEGNAGAGMSNNRCQNISKEYVILV